MQLPHWSASPLFLRLAHLALRNSISASETHLLHVLYMLLQVQYAALSHFEERYDEFLAETTLLRNRFRPDGARLLAEVGQCTAQA